MKISIKSLTIFVFFFLLFILIVREKYINQNNIKKFDNIKNRISKLREDRNCVNVKGTVEEISILFDVDYKFSYSTYPDYLAPTLNYISILEEKCGGDRYLYYSYTYDYIFKYYNSLKKSPSITVPLSYLFFKVSVLKDLKNDIYVNINRLSQTQKIGDCKNCSKVKSIYLSKFKDLIE